MTEWKAKRFWTKTETTEEAGGFGVALDGRPVRTPSKAALIVPTQAMATAIAAEWDAQTDEIDPAVMPVTRSANAAIDKVSTQFAEVAGLIAAYGESDLLCYRAEGPDELAARQSEAWDPLLEWSANELNAPLAQTVGIMPVTQDPATLAALSEAVAAFDPYRLTAVHDLVGISGSLVLGLAVTRGRLDPSEAWRLSRIDEDWQIEQWGADEEDVAATEFKRLAFLHAAAFFCLCG